MDYIPKCCGEITILIVGNHGFIAQLHEGGMHCLGMDGTFVSDSFSSLWHCL